MGAVELEGLLARGRGAGWLGALERGAVAPLATRELVLRQVIEDPRWDRQVESREEYYAGILLALGCEVGPLVEALVGRDEDQVWLIRGVLMQLAWRGHLGALAALVDRVRRGVDEDLLGDFEHLAGAERAAQLAALAGRPFTPLPPRPPPWRPPLELIEGIDALAELVRGPTGPGPIPRKLQAARRLGALDHGDLLPDAEAFLRAECGLTLAQRHGRHVQRRAWLLYLEALPSARTLALARAWFDQPWPLSLAAEKILVRHAEPDDRPTLEAACARALAEHDTYRLCSTLEALDGLAAPESIALLVEVYDTTDYAWARERACAALLAHRDHADAQARLVEGLWDCESSTRALACEGVSASRRSERLRELADDPFEHEDVREAAARALADRQT